MFVSLLTRVLNKISFLPIVTLDLTWMIHRLKQFKISYNCQMRTDLVEHCSNQIYIDWRIPNAKKNRWNTRYRKHATSFFLQISRVAESICSLPLIASIFMNGTDCKQNFTITTPAVTFEALSILPLSLHAEGRIVRKIVFVKWWWYRMVCLHTLVFMFVIRYYAPEA